MADKAFESEELRLFHKKCREGKALEIANATSISPSLLNTRSVITGRTVRARLVIVASRDNSNSQHSGSSYKVNIRSVHPTL